MKRVFDFITALFCLLILSPVLLVVTIMVKVKLGGSVFFSQVRPGLNSHPFKMYKFKTMKEDRDINGCSLPDEQRLTPFGNKLRHSSLDELPGLWNVLIGNMSLVGPRPLLIEYLPLYNEREAKRHNVKPGITGWAQVNGRNAISWSEKFELDVWYVENHNFIFDLKILFKTVRKVFVKEGISAKGHATIEPFRGHDIE